MPHACGLALMRRIGLLAIGLSFALMAVGPALSLTQIPAQLERERVMQELIETPADHKGGGWRSGDYELALNRASAETASLGNMASLTGFILLILGAWLARHEPDARRILHLTAGTAILGVTLGVAGTIARRADLSASPVGTFDVIQVSAVGIAFALLAASRGSRLALGLGLTAAALLGLKQLLILDQMAWQSGLARHAYVTVPLLLFLGWTLTAAAFAAGAAHDGSDGKTGARALPAQPAQAS